MGAPQEKSKVKSDWWKPVREDAPEWEILPQEAGPGEVILSKRNELGLLSNFAHTPFLFRGHTYASVEGFWQMMKFPGDIAAAEEDPRRAASWPYTRFQVAALYGMAAKEAGETANQKMQVLGISWLSFEGVRIEYRGKNQHEHYQIIFEATLAKVEQNSRVRELLLETGDLVLRPDHYVEPGAVTPASRYNEIAMKIRSQLRAS